MKTLKFTHRLLEVWQESHALVYSLPRRTNKQVGRNSKHEPYFLLQMFLTDCVTVNNKQRGDLVFPPFYTCLIIDSIGCQKACVSVITMEFVTNVSPFYQCFCIRLVSCDCRLSGENASLWKNKSRVFSQDDSNKHLSKINFPANYNFIFRSFFSEKRNIEDDTHALIGRKEAWKCRKSCARFIDELNHRKWLK